MLWAKQSLYSRRYLLHNILTPDVLALPKKLELIVFFVVREAHSVKLSKLSLICAPRPRITTNQMLCYIHEVMCFCYCLCSRTCSVSSYCQVLVGIIVKLPANRGCSAAANMDRLTAHQNGFNHYSRSRRDGSSVSVSTTNGMWMTGQTPLFGVITAWRNLTCNFVNENNCWKLF